MTRCEYCGRESSIKEVFQKIYPGFSKPKVLACPSCQIIVGREVNKRSNYLSAVAVVTVLIILNYRPESFIGWLILNFCLYIYIFSRVALVIHEAGHFLVAKLLGGYVPKVVIGNGRLLFSINILKTRWEFRSEWSHGITFGAIHNEASFSKFKVGLVLLGGALGNLFAASIVFIGWGDEVQLDGLINRIDWLMVFVFSNLATAVYAMWPMHISRLSHLPTDGRQLVYLITKDPKYAEQVELQYHILRLYHLFDKDKLADGLKLTQQYLEDFPNNLYLLLFKSLFMLELGKVDEGIAFAKDSLSRIKKQQCDRVQTQYMVALLENNIAYGYSLKGNEFLNEFQEYIESAYKKTFWEPGIIETYASMLVHKGEIETALQELARARQLMIDDRNLIHNYITCAKACLAKGDKEEAEKYIGKVKSYAELSNAARRALAEIE